MFKWIRRLMLLFFLAAVAAVIFLVPARVNTSDRLENIQGDTNLTSLVQSLSPSQVDPVTMTAQISLRTGQFNQVLKSILGQTGSNELTQTAYSLEGDHLRMQTPLELGPIESKLDMEFTASVADQRLVLRPVSARLGQLPLPVSLVMDQLRSRYQGTSDAITITADELSLPLPADGLTIQQVTIQSGEAVLTLGLSS